METWSRDKTLPGGLPIVVIRGIPKEGWKRNLSLADGAGRLTVVIRGIPKEGWKQVL